MIETSIGTVSLSVFHEVLALREKHRLEIVGDRIRPTVSMLADIALLFPNRITPSQAWQVWKICLAVEANSLGKDLVRSEVAFWYGVDPHQMTDRQLASLKCNLYRVKAQKKIHDGNFDPCNYEAVYQLFLMAFDDEEQALQARARSIELLMERKQ